MKVVSSTLAVFLSVVVIVLACFDSPTITPPPIAAQARSKAAMRQWQTEVAQLYQSQRETAERESVLPHSRPSPVQTAAVMEPPKIALVRPASLTVESRPLESNPSMKQTSMKQTSARQTSARQTSAEIQGSRPQIIDWAEAAVSAKSDADRWAVIAETMTPQGNSRSRSFWAWMVALIAGGFSVLGLLLCHFWDPERTFEPDRPDSNSSPSQLDEITFSIPTEWLEMRQSIGFRIRHWAGWGLVITALVAVVWM